MSGIKRDSGTSAYSKLMHKAAGDQAGGESCGVDPAHVVRMKICGGVGHGRLVAAHCGGMLDRWEFVIGGI